MGFERNSNMYVGAARRFLAPWHESDPYEKLEKARAGDKDALSEVVVAMHPFALAVARYMAPNSSSVEDFAQDAMIATIRAAQTRSEALTPQGLPRLVADTVRRSLQKEEVLFSRQIPRDPFFFG